MAFEYGFTDIIKYLIAKFDGPFDFSNLMNLASVNLQINVAELLIEEKWWDYDTSNLIMDLLRIGQKRMAKQICNLQFGQESEKRLRQIKIKLRDSGDTPKKLKNVNFDPIFGILKNEFPDHLSYSKHGLANYIDTWYALFQEIADPKLEYEKNNTAHADDPFLRYRSSRYNLRNTRSRLDKKIKK